MVHRIGNKVPRIAVTAFVAWNAEVAGEVTLGAETSVWFSATLRADLAPLTVGGGSNIQDGATLHVDTGLPLSLGERVTVGHNAVLHGGAVIGKESIVGAGALVTEDKVFPPRSLVLGSPAKAVRQVDDAALIKVRENARNYTEVAREAARDYRELDQP